MLKSFWFWLLVLFIAIQAIPVTTIPSHLTINSKDELETSTEIMEILKRSCYDCHSSEVEEPWYYKVAPASWYVQRHVRQGREIVNFSKWSSYDKEKKLKLLDKLPKSVVIRMPMLSYTYVHKNAILTDKEKKLLTQWARDLKEKIK